MYTRCHFQQNPFDRRNSGVCDGIPARSSSFSLFHATSSPDPQPVVRILLLWATTLLGPWAPRTMSRASAYPDAPSGTVPRTQMCALHLACDRVPGTHKCAPRRTLRLRLMIHSAKMLLVQVHQTAETQRPGNWQGSSATPTSSHASLEIPFAWAFCRASLQCTIHGLPNVGPDDWYPGPVIFGSNGLREQ